MSVWVCDDDAWHATKWMNGAERKRKAAALKWMYDPHLSKDGVRINVFVVESRVHENAHLGLR